MYTKKGVDYRPISCYYDDSNKILISKFGLRGYAILQLILNKIYLENGYFVKWTDDLQELFSMEIKAQTNIVKNVVDYLLERGVFDKKMYKDFSILTSYEIQQEYSRITYKRVNQWHTPSYVYSSILSNQNDINLSQNNNETGENNDNNNTEKRTAKKSNSESQSNSESESNSKISEPTPALLLSQKLNKQLKNPNLKIDVNEINLDKLCNAVLESDFLQKANNLTVDWLVKNYDKVIRGDYKNISTTTKNNNTAIIHQRDYTKEEKQFCSSNIDDFID